MTRDEPQAQQATVQDLQARLDARDAELLAARAACTAAEAALLEQRIGAGGPGAAQAPSFWRQHGAALLAAGLMAPLIVVLIVMHHDASTRARTCEARLRGEAEPVTPPIVGEPPRTPSVGPAVGDPPAVGTAVVEPVGVPECDDFLSKYTACVEGRIPESSREAMRSSLRTMREAWRNAARSEEGRRSLAQACVTVKESARKATAAFNCQW